MKIAFITNIIPPYRRSFYSKLSNIKGLELLVIYGVEEQETGKPGLTDSNFFDFKSHKAINHLLKLGPFSVRFQTNFYKKILTFNPDVIILLGASGTISNWLIGIWAILKNIKIMMWTCAWEAQDKNTIAYFIKKQLMRFFFKIPDIILVYSSTAKRYLSEIGINPKKIEICYNGIEIDPFIEKKNEIQKASDELLATENPDKKFIFLYVGGILKEKKIRLLIKAFSKSQKIRSNAILWIVGDGPDTKSIVKTIDELKIKNIKFWGRIIDNVDKYFLAADVFVLPGMGGLALNQAMYWRTPCICSTADGTENDLVIMDKTGYRFKENNLNSLIEMMEIAYHDCSLNKNLQMKNKAQQLITQRSNVSIMIKTFSYHLRQLM